MSFCHTIPSQVQGKWSVTHDSQSFLAPGKTYFIDQPLVEAWPCTFSSYTSRGPRGVSPWYRRGRSHLDLTYPTTCFRSYPKATFMTTQLRSSVWKPQSMTYTIWDSTPISGQRTLVCVSFARQTDNTYSWCLIVGLSDTASPTHIYIVGAISNITMTHETWSSTQHMYQLISMS
jgi:hypothetical protein